MKRHRVAVETSLDCIEASSELQWSFAGRASAAWAVGAALELRPGCNGARRSVSAALELWPGLQWSSTVVGMELRRSVGAALELHRGCNGAGRPRRCYVGGLEHCARCDSAALKASLREV